MESFRWIAVALSMVLGLGVTRLLSAVVAAFRSRGRARLDWIPFVWAGCVFLWQIQYWWAVIELPGLIETWTLLNFLVLLGLTLLLFVAGALVLPPTELGEGDDLAASFARDGRWALLCLSAYFLLALLADWLLWGVSPYSRFGALLTGLVLLPLVYLGTSSRRAHAIVTGLYVPLSLFAAWDLSPASY